MSNNTVAFKPKARLLLQLGDQLIRNEAIALFELVKNCYDANASFAKVSFFDLDFKEKAKIVVEDDGDGMDLDIITNVWMQPGTDYKEKLFQKNKNLKNQPQRLPIGEKGIGRFGAYKLGNTIEIVTKTGSSKKEIYFKIDWSSFQNADFLQDVHVEFFEREPEVFINPRNKGTVITIANVKRTWERPAFRETLRLLNTLNTPGLVKNIDNFNLEITENMGWALGILDLREMSDLALFSGKIVLENNLIKRFDYHFTPWNSMKQISGRDKKYIDIEMKNETRNDETRRKEFPPIDLSEYKIGKIKIIVYAYSLDPGILKLGVSDKAGFRKYLKENGGMKVYRDGMRVYDYGEKNNDWLNMDIRRVNQPGSSLGNNQYIGYVLLDRADSSDLIEKSNREGFVENDAYVVFRDAVWFALKQFEIERNRDKLTLNNYYGAKRTQEPLVQRLSELKDLVLEEVKEKKLQERILLELARIETEYNDIIEIFLKNASAGINMGVAIHEIDKIVYELNNVLKSKNESSIQHAIKLASRLTELVKGYTLLIKGKDKGEYEIKTLVQQSIFNVEYRLQAHKITIETNIDKFKPTYVKCARNISLGSILNLIDNSIWWLSYSNIKERKIYIGLSNEYKDHISVVVADNGPGFSIPVNDMVKPFISAKPTGGGMGLGLFIANQCMEDQGGELIFPDFDDFVIPETYKNGAISVLAFRRNLNDNSK